MKNLMTLPLALALAACAQNAPPPKPAAPTPATDPAAAAADTPAATDARALDAYHWRLESATDAAGTRIDALFPGTDHVLTLDFAGKRIAVSGGCNGQSGGYRIDDQNRLEVARLAATMKACAAPLMQADEAIGKWLAQPLQWRVEESLPPRLRLVAADGSSTTWTGEATAETRYGGAGETVFMEVAPQRIDCHHPMMPDYKCLQVREIRYDDSGVKQPPGEWQAFYGDIEGFEFREGERKVLRLKRFRRDPAPADASSIAYVLDMVVESELVPTSK